MSRTFECPLCGSSLSRETYEQVLHIDEARKKELAEAEAKLARERSLLKREREQIAVEESAKAKKEEIKLQKQLDELQSQHKQTKAALVAKSAISAKEKRRIEREATQKIETRYSQQLRREEEKRERIEERRERENDTWRRKIEELQRRAEAHDSSHFGPEGEEELERLLRRQFPMDDIQRKRRGGDIIHVVIENRQPCGTIVYECKRTNQWQPAYLRQLKRAMETNETKCGLLVSRVLPPKHTGLCIVDGIIVTSPQFARHLAVILRDALVELSRAQLSEDGKAEKTEDVYRYLRSAEFKNALQVIDSRTKELRGELEREKSNHEGWWTRREQHYAAIARHAVGITTEINSILATVPRGRGQLAKVHNFLK